MKKIEFIPINDLTKEIIFPPQLASKFIPDWYKNINSHLTENNVHRYPLNSHGHESNLTVKRCLPFFDTITSGYIITLPCDVVFVDPQKYNNRVIWDVSFEPIGSHGIEQIFGMPLPEDKNSILKWNFNYIIKTPPGYSCYFSHPKYRFDLPFTTLDGIVDTDKHIVPVNFPFLISENFMGKIKMGTPICQIYPFKRDSWKMSVEKVNKKNIFMMDKLKLIVDNSYKNRFWEKKKFI
jgi:hypothetical protein